MLSDSIHNFTQKSQSGNWIVEISPSTNYGYFQNILTEKEGGLWFKNRMVIEYDGVFELPKDVIKCLRRLKKTFDINVLPNE